MSYPPQEPQYPPGSQYPYYPQQPPARPGSDHTVLFGWLGIVLGLCCCGFLGFVFGALSVTNAKRWGNSPVLGYIAIVAGVVNIIGQAIANLTRSYPWYH